MTTQQIQNLIGFLQRVQLSGNEVPAFNELIDLLTNDYKKQTEATKDDKDTKSDVPTNRKPQESK